MHCKLKSIASFRYLIAGIVAIYLLCFFAPLETDAKQLQKKCGSLKHRTFKKSAASLVPEEIPFRAEVRKYIGLPYKRGGTGENGIDCSGLTKNIYADVFGVELPHNSYAQSRTDFLEPLPLSTELFEASDLLFFTGDKKKINHVGVYLGEGKFIHATSKRGVIISDLNESAYYQRRLVASRRIKKSVLAKAQGEMYASTVDGKDILLNQNISLGYAISAQNQLGITVETFLERNLTATDDTSTWPINILSGDVETDLPMDVETWKGVRASADIRPVNGMRITPSMSVIDGSSLLEREPHLWKTYGIEAAIAPTGSSWSIALSLYSILNPTDMKNYHGMEATDMGLRFNYRISDTVRFSLKGNWGDFGKEKNGQDADYSPAETQDLSFNLGVSF